MNAFPEFTGTLSFSVTGPGVSIDPATGAVSIAAEQLQEGIEVAISAAEPDGTATGRFRLTFQAVGTPPRLVAAPALAGPAVIGTPAEVDPGSWEDAGSLALQWRRDGADIAGADTAAYVPVAADDRCQLSCHVTATNAAGSTTAETAAVEVIHAAPRVVAALPDLELELDTGPAVVEAAAAFAGEALAFAAEGAGAGIDPATGRVTIPTDALVAAATVTVTAGNSGGSAAASFKVTVEAATTLAPPAAVGRIADVTFPLDDAVHSVSTQSSFSGSELVYALETAPAGATIHAGSGLVEFAATAPLVAAPVTVRASNAAGAATQSFTVTIRALATVFDATAKLDEVSFVHEGAAPSWTLKGGILARLEPAATGRVHGNWSLGGGDGLYRALARWNSTNTGVNGSSPFLFGARIARSGTNFGGLYVEATKVSATERQLRLLEYTGAGSATTLLASTSSDWVWYTWYWFEMEVAGTSVKARLYAEDAQAPAWQLQATTTHTAAGFFGPSAFPIGGVGPLLDIKRLDFVPGTGATPPAASDGDWALNQITEQK